MGVAFGVVLGSILQLLVSSLGLYGMGFDYRFKIFWKNKGLHQVLRLLPPRSLDQGIDYVNGLVETNLASRMAAGSVRAYQQATALSFVPINLIGVAISTAAFPKMTERLGEGRPDLFKKELQSVLRVIVWLALPVTIIAYFCRGYLIHFIKPGGDPYMAGILAILALSILFRSVYFISARSFYAQQDTKTPLYISLFTISLNIVLAIWFSMGLNMGVYGLAWAAVVVSGVEVAILFFVMSRRIEGLFDSPFINSIMRMISATGLTAIITYIAVAMMPLGAEDVFASAFVKFALIVGISALTYIIICRIFKLDEVNPILHRIRNILFKQPKVNS
jgi:putative peptidoglycan lipid II flippase